MTVPTHISSQTKENKYTIDEIRVGGIAYIALPTHSNFGSPVRVIQQIQDGKRLWYLIEDPLHTGFHMRMLAHWLSATPVEETESLLDRTAVVLPLSALDKLVQMILGKNRQWRAEKDEPAAEQTTGTHLAAISSGEQDATEPLPLLHDPQPGRRHSS
jgi:hypothetical protein